MRISPGLLRAVRLRHLHAAASLLLWVIVFGLLETTGRAVPNDFGDGIALLGLVCLGLVTLAWDRRTPLSWVHWLRRRLARARAWVRAWRIDLGVDLRGEPPLPRAAPRPYLRLCTSLGILALLAFAARSIFPYDARSVLLRCSVSVYLIYLAALWSALLLGSLFFLFVPCALIHDRFVKHHGRRRGRPWRSEMMVLGGGLTLVALLAVLVPATVPVALMGALLCLLVVSLLVPSKYPLTLVWRRPPFGEPVALRWTDFALLQLFTASAGVALLLVLSRGDLLFAPDKWVEDALVVTPGLGFLFSWAATLGMLAFCYQIGLALWLRLLATWSAHLPTTVFANGVTSPRLQRRFRRALHRSGIAIRFSPEPPRAEDVKVLCREAVTTTDGGFQPEQWPLPVTLDSLMLPANLHRFVRRDQIQKRRRILRAMKKLFKEAAGREFRRGEGFWIGLQHWFVTGFSRDRAEEASNVEQDTFFDDTIGPPYRKLVDWRARQHFREITGALEVDLIFVADDVTFAQFRRVVECLFEVFDIFGEYQRAEEKHFVGLPGTRVVIHDFTLDRPFRNKRYPEPDYEDIGRARILHVFRDSGGTDDVRDRPTEWEDLTLPKVGGFPGF
jgi:hypothetical protein